MKRTAFVLSLLSILCGAAVSGTLATYRHLGVEAAIFFGLCFMITVARGLNGTK